MGKNNMTPEQMIVKAMRLNIIAMILLVISMALMIWGIYV